MLKRLFYIIFLLPLGLSAQAVDSLQAVQTADTLLIKSEEALTIADEVLALPETAPSQALDTLSVLQKVYDAESAVVDSVNKVLTTPERQVNKGIDQIESKTTDKYNNAASEVNEGLSGVDINKSVSEAGIEGVGGAGGVNGVVPSASELVNGVMPEGVDLKELEKARDALGQGEAALSGGKAIGAEAERVASGDLSNTEYVDRAVEQQVAKSAAMQELQNQAGGMEALPDGSEMNPSLIAEEKIRNYVVTEATNYFAAQAAPLQKGVASVGKYKRKYKDVESFKNKQFVKRSSLADKSFRERIVPGLTFHVINGNQLILDFMPQVTYRLNTKWQVGVGGVLRTNIEKKGREQAVKYEVYGLGAVSTFQVWKSFWLYAEADRNQVVRYIPSQSTDLPPDIKHFTDFDLLVGIKKSHQFTRHVKGHAQVLYNFAYDKQISPYAKKLHLRFGFEWYFKAKKEEK